MKPKDPAFVFLFANDMFSFFQVQVHEPSPPGDPQPADDHPGQQEGARPGEKKIDVLPKPEQQQPVGDFPRLPGLPFSTLVPSAPKWKGEGGQ